MKNFLSQIRDDEKIDNKFKQPIMRFKPRTDLERIYDTINSVYYGSVKKDLVNKQIKNLQYIKPVNDEVLSNEEEENDSALNKNIEKFKENNKSEKKNSMLKIDNSKELMKKSNNNFKKRKLVNNSEARLFRKELYNKTHFKATTDFSIFKSILNK